MLIIVEGNIGVGKSTLSKNLAEVYNFRLFEEGADTNRDFVEYLNLYYKDPDRYALEMQFWLLSVRFKQHQEALNHIHKTGQCCIMDRSIYGDTVFAHRNYLDGNISRLGYDSYLKHREVMLQFLMVPQLTIYLDASPERCLNRIMDRKRTSEVGIELAYLKGIDDLYKGLLIELENRGSNVQIFDWSNFLPVETIGQKIADFLCDYRWDGYRFLAKNYKTPSNQTTYYQ